MKYVEDLGSFVGMMAAIVTGIWVVVSWWEFVKGLALPSPLELSLSIGPVLAALRFALKYREKR